MEPPAARGPEEGPTGHAAGAARRGLPAGVVDSAASSLSSFLVGLVAVRYLPAAELGAYALAYSAFILAAAVPGMLIYTPAEVLSIQRFRGRDRLAVLHSSLPLGLRVGAVAGMLVGAASLAVPSTTPFGVSVAFAVTVAALTAVSAMQDHVRRVLHQAGLSWDAAATSGLQLVLCAALIGGVLIAGIGDSPWVPFTVLAAAKTASAAYALSRSSVGQGVELPLTLRQAADQGGALLFGTLATYASGAVAVAIVTVASGPAAAGQFEAVRLLSQPVTVVVVGLLAVLGPEIMTAATGARVRQAHRSVLTFLLLIGLLTAAYAAVAVAPWPGNPLPALVPRAYEVEGLLVLMIVSQATLYAATAYRQVPLALRVNKDIVVVDVLTAVVGVLATLALASLGAVAAVLGAGASAFVALIGFALSAAVRLRRVSRHAPDAA